MRAYEKTLADGFRRTGFAITNLLLAGIIIAAPELSLGRRAIFVFAVAAVALAFNWLHKRYVPNAIVNLSARTSEAGAGGWPQFVSWVLAVVAAVVAAIIYGLLKGELHVPSAWL